MTHSFAQEAELTCPQCGQTFSADVWLIVDAAERPDLLERARAGTLHDLPCPHCGHRGAVDVPLLILRPGQEPSLLFSPAQGTTAEQDREQAAGLVGALRERLGDAWQEEWVRQGLPGVQRPMLPAALSEDPEAALQQMAEQAQQVQQAAVATREALEALLPEERARVLLEKMLAQEPVALRPEDLDEVMFRVLAGLQAEATLRSERAQRLAELEARLRQVLAQAEAGNSIPPEFQADLRRAQEAEGRYLRTGDRAALDEAAAAWECILGHAAFVAAPERFQLAALNNSGGVFLRRYWARGRLEDLNQALACWQQAVGRTPPDSPDLPGYLNNLGLGLRDRYARTGQLADLEQAIRVYQQAVERTPPDSPDLPSILNNLSTGLSDRYARTGRLDDLEEAITAYQQTVQYTPPDSPDLPMYLNNLGNGLSDRYARTGVMTDLESAIAVYRQAVQRTPPDSPELPGYLNNLGTGLRDRYARTGQWADLEEAIGFYEQATGTLDRAFLLSPVAYQLGQQSRWAGLHANAVAVRLQAGQPTHALALAEGSKSRLLTALVGRGALPAPAAISTALVEQERDLAGQLNALDAADLARHGLAIAGAEEAARLQRLEQRQALVEHLQPIWQEMEACGPLAQDYVALRRGDRPDWEDLARLATDVGPETALVSLFTTGESTLLFVLRAGMAAPQAVEMPLDGAGWQDLLRRFLREVHFYDGTGRRAETWPTSLIPLLQEAAPHLGGARWVVLAPHAGGHLLPWGALAGRAGWAAALATVPALGVLTRTLDRPSGETAGALVVGNPLGDLRHAEEEAQQVATLLGARPLLRQQATRAAVLRQLEQAGLAHFATHAYFAPGSPLDSGIVLADGILTAREILERGLRAPEFLALSACQTGMAGPLGGDEMAGLSQALVYAGARSLLVSLWAVDDPATAHLMAGFYRGWREQGLDKATVLREAMEATRRARPAWAHTYYWGAFILVGDWR